MLVIDYISGVNMEIISSPAMGNIIAGMSVVLSVVFAILYVRERQIAAYGVENAYIQDLLKWHAEVIETLSRMKALAIMGDVEHLPRYREHLSALIEQGRFFFPNIDRGDGFGLQKPPAYRGYRNLALDFLVALYELYKKTDSIDIVKATHLQRYFTSIVFEVIQPIRRIKHIYRLTKKYLITEKSFEDLMRGNEEVVRSIW